MAVQLLGLAVIGFLIDRNEFYSLQMVIDKIDRMSPAEIEFYDAQSKHEVLEMNRKRRGWGKVTAAPETLAPTPAILQ
jgi:hypothetical protein